MSVFINEVDNDSSGVVMIGTINNNVKGGTMKNAFLIRSNHTKMFDSIEVKKKDDKNEQLFVATITSIAYYYLLNPTTIRMEYRGNGTSGSNDYSVVDGAAYQLEVDSSGNIKGFTKNS